MPEQDHEIVLRMRKLANRVRLGWQKLHPVRRKDLDLVHQVVREQWAKEQSLAREAAKAQQTSQPGQTYEQSPLKQGRTRDTAQNETEQARQQRQQQDRERRR